MNRELSAVNIATHANLAIRLINSTQTERMTITEMIVLNRLYCAGRGIIYSHLLKIVFGVEYRAKSASYCNAIQRLLRMGLIRRQKERNGWLMIITMAGKAMLCRFDELLKEYA